MGMAQLGLPLCILEGREQEASGGFNNTGAQELFCHEELTY